MAGDGLRVALGTNRYPGAVHPQGQRYLKEFRREPCAAAVFDVDGLESSKSVWMVQGENTTVIEYREGDPSRRCAMLPVCRLP